MITHPAADCALLLRGLHEALEIPEARWDRVLRLARMTGLHGRLAAANADNPTVSERVRRHLLSATRMADFSARMLDAELRDVAPLCGGDFPVIALKGGAYALQALGFARGRFVSDIDLLVPARALRTMEARLHAAGWESAALDPYDERYYRDWSHETPPLRFPGHFLELDLHHAITPVTGRRHFDPAPLFDESLPIAGSRFRVLSARDQVLHACVHCFQDGDLALRVREIADIDGLLRSFAGTTGFWPGLVERANALGLGRPLWYGLHFARSWMQTPVPQEVLSALPGPAAVLRRPMEACISLALLPPEPDRPPGLSVRFARRLALARYHLLRMPLHMLLPHLARKAWLRTRRRTPDGANENAGGGP